MFIYLTM